MRSDLNAFSAACAQSPAEHGRDETSAGFERARQVLHASSAIYVILMVGRSPQLAEVCAAMDRVHDWMSELREAVAPSPSPSPGRAELERAASSLERAVGALDRLLSRHAAVDVSLGARDAAAGLANAASCLDRTREARADQSRFMSTCCALDIPRLAESRAER